jgi:hypothetical protein
MGSETRPIPAKYGSPAFYKLECVGKYQNPVEVTHGAMVKYFAGYLPQLNEYVTQVDGRYYLAPSYPIPSRNRGCWISFQE